MNCAIAGCREGEADAIYYGLSLCYRCRGLAYCIPDVIRTSQLIERVLSIAIEDVDEDCLLPGPDENRETELIRAVLTHVLWPWNDLPSRALENESSE